MLLSEIHQGEMMGPTTIYTLGPPLCWSPAQLGVYNAVSQTIQCALPAPCVALLSACHFSDRSILILAILNSLIVYVLRAASFNSTMFYTAAAISFMNQVIGPVTRSMTSQTVAHSSYGSVFAIFSACKSASMLVGITVFSQVLSLTVRGWTGAFYAVGAGFDVLCLTTAIIYVRRFKRYEYVELDTESSQSNASSA